MTTPTRRCSSDAGRSSENFAAHLPYKKDQIWGGNTGVDYSEKKCLGRLYTVFSARLRHDAVTIKDGMMAIIAFVTFNLLCRRKAGFVSDLQMIS